MSKYIPIHAITKEALAGQILEKGEAWISVSYVHWESDKDNKRLFEKLERLGVVDKTVQTITQDSSYHRGFTSTTTITYTPSFHLVIFLRQGKKYRFIRLKELLPGDKYQIRIVLEQRISELTKYKSGSIIRT